MNDVLILTSSSFALHWATHRILTFEDHNPTPLVSSCCALQNGVMS
jgi:hypothetical protein